MMRPTPPNKPDAVNPAMAPRFQVGRQSRGVTDPDRLATFTLQTSFSYAKFGDGKHFDLWKKLNADPNDLEVRRNMAITQPLLWIANLDEVPLPKRVKE